MEPPCSSRAFFTNAAEFFSTTLDMSLNWASFSDAVQFIRTSIGLSRDVIFTELSSKEPPWICRLFVLLHDFVEFCRHFCVSRLRVSSSTLLCPCELSKAIFQEIQGFSPDLFSFREPSEISCVAFLSGIVLLWHPLSFSPGRSSLTLLTLKSHLAYRTLTFFAFVVELWRTT